MMTPKIVSAHWLTAACAALIPTTSIAQDLVDSDLGLDVALYGLDDDELAMLFDNDEAEAGSLREALQGGHSWVNFRLRHEEVDADASPKKGHASTLRTRLGYETGMWNDLSGTLEFDDVHFVAYDAYTGGGHTRAGRPTVADPQGAGLNQASITWHGENDSTATLGRQKLEVNNERFIGDVGWRQNDQTFDAAVYNNPAVGPVALMAAYIRGQNTVAGGKTNMDGIVLNVTKEFEDVGTVGVYDYAFEFDAVDSSTNTIGAFFDGRVSAGDDIDVLFRVEGANQSDFGDSDITVDTSYMRAQVGGEASGWTAILGTEVLGGADGNDASFSTPLATGHAFNGWADVFLTTPAAGLVDNFVQVSTSIADIDLDVIYHAFTADDSVADDDFGSEVDFRATKALSENSNAGVKVASYSAGSGNAATGDVMKAWLWVTYSF
ncbi:MAG: hypothetical protein ACI841_002630 [Planctomycetota bacterium]|jgi:hypothetical protein